MWIADVGQRWAGAVSGMTWMEGENRKETEEGEGLVMIMLMLIGS